MPSRTADPFAPCRTPGPSPWGSAVQAPAAVDEPRRARTARTIARQPSMPAPTKSNVTTVNATLNPLHRDAQCHADGHGEERGHCSSPCQRGPVEPGHLPGEQEAGREGPPHPQEPGHARCPLWWLRRPMSTNRQACTTRSAAAAIHGRTVGAGSSRTPQCRRPAAGRHHRGGSGSRRRLLASAPMTATPTTTANAAAIGQPGRAAARRVPRATMHAARADPKELRAEGDLSSHHFIVSALAASTPTTPCCPRRGSRRRRAVVGAARLDRRSPRGTREFGRGGTYRLGGPRRAGDRR